MTGTKCICATTDKILPNITLVRFMVFYNGLSIACMVVITTFGINGGKIFP